MPDDIIFPDHASIYICTTTELLFLLNYFLRPKISAVFLLRRFAKRSILLTKEEKIPTILKSTTQQK